MYVNILVVFLVPALVRTVGSRDTTQGGELGTGGGRVQGATVPLPPDNSDPLRSQRSPPERRRGGGSSDDRPARKGSSLSSSSSSQNRADRQERRRQQQQEARDRDKDREANEGSTNARRNVSWSYRHVSWSLEDFPDPKKEPERCGRAHRKPSMVCDPNRLLTPSEGRKLDKAAAAICSQTGCPCNRNCSSVCPGFKVGVAVVPSITASGNLRPDESKTEEAKEGAVWADNLRTQVWKMGTCDDDVTLVLAKDQKTVYLSVGQRARVKLTDVCADSIYKDAQRHLDQDNIGPALHQMLRDINAAFHDDFKCVLSFSETMPTGKVIGIIFASIGPVVLIVVIMIFLGPCFRGRGFGGSSGSKHRSYHHRRGYEPADMVMDGPGRGGGGGGGGGGMGRGDEFT